MPVRLIQWSDHELRHVKQSQSIRLDLTTVTIMNLHMEKDFLLQYIFYYFNTEINLVRWS